VRRTALSGAGEWTQHRWTAEGRLIRTSREETIRRDRRCVRGSLKASPRLGGLGPSACGWTVQGRKTSRGAPETAKPEEGAGRTNLRATVRRANVTSTLGSRSTTSVVAGMDSRKREHVPGLASLSSKVDVTSGMCSLLCKPRAHSTSEEDVPPGFPMYKPPGLRVWGLVPFSGLGGCPVASFPRALHTVNGAGGKPGRGGSA
jgi:hypothetical protein